MQVKLILACIVISLCLSTINTIIQATAQRKARKQKEHVAELDKQYQILIQQTQEYKERLTAHQAQLYQAQIVIDSLNHRQSQLNAEIKSRDKQYENLKFLLSSPKTNFSDSTKAQILNNLPQ